MRWRGHFADLKSRTIGIIVPYLYDPFFATIAHAINTVAKENSYSVILTTSNEDAGLRVRRSPNDAARGVDGLIVIPSDAHRSRLSRAEFDKTHIVTLDRPVQDRRFDTVLVHNQSGSKRAVQHLLNEHGHRRVVFIGLNKQLYTVRARFEGYRRAMLEAGLQPEPFSNAPPRKRLRRSWPV